MASAALGSDIVNVEVDAGRADAQGGEPGSRGSNRSNDPYGSTVKAGEASVLPAQLGEEAGQGSPPMGGDQPGTELDALNDRASEGAKQED